MSTATASAYLKALGARFGAVAEPVVDVGFRIVERGTT